MSKVNQVEELASRLEATYMAVIEAAEKCTDEQWKMRVEEEERPVGVVFHHMAYGIPPVMDWAMAVATGQGLPGVSREMVHEFNRQHAVQHALTSPADTIALMRQAGAAAVEQVRQLSDAQMATTTPFVLLGGNEITTSQVIEWFIVNHCHSHLEAIAKTLAAA